ncbi:mechanosensitive ion channel family protein [Nocardioides ultimimeridianus]
MTTPSLAPLSIDWSGIFSDNLKNVINFVPKLIVFLVVLFIGWLIAKAVAKGLGLLLQRVGFTRLLAKAGADQALASAQIKPIDLITKLVYYFVLLIALQLALSAFGPTNPVSAIVNDIVNWLPKALVAIVIVVIAGAVANAVRDLLSASLGGVSYGGLLARIAAIFIIALGVIAALNQVGIGLSVTLPVLIAVLGTIGGILVVGVGGGLIVPMRSRWETWLDQLAADTKGNHAAEVPPAPPAV